MQEENNKIIEQLDKIIKAVNRIDEKVFNLENRIDKMEKLKEAPAEETKEFVKLPESLKLSGFKQATEEKEKLEQNEIIGEEKIDSKAIKEENFESEIGLKWLGRIGILALVFGISFFLKFAFENNWIGETGRIIIGIAAGIGLIGLGEFSRKKYLNYAQILTGGGIAVLYLSIYASFNFYHLIGQAPAFLAMIAVTGAAGFLAIHYEKIGLAGIGILGGFLTPFLLNSVTDSQPWLFIYIILLNLGILGISFFRNWQKLNLLGLFGTIAIFISWYGRFYSGDQFLLTQIFLTASFIIYAVASISYNILAKNKADENDIMLIILNAAFYFGANYFLLSREHSEFLGFFAVLMALAYFILACASNRFNPDDKRLALFLPLISIFFITIAAPIQFDGKLVTISWIIEAAVLIWLGFSLNDYRIRKFAWIVFALGAIRLVFFDTGISGSLENYTIIFNERFFTFVIGIVSAFAIYYCYSVYKKSVERDETHAKPAILITANFLFLLILSLEAITFFDKKIENVKLPMQPDCQVKVYEKGKWGKYTTNFYCEQRYEEFEKERVEILAERKKIKSASNTSLSLLWGIYAIALLGFGILRKNRILRLMGIGLFGIVILKLFFYDLWSLGTLYRIISSISLGIILLAASFAYHKYKYKIREII